MNESSNNPAGERSGIGEAVSSALRQPSFFRVMLVLAATVVVLVGLRLSAPVLNPILFAVVFSLLCAPVYGWLRRRLPTGLALLITFVGLLIFFVVLAAILGISITRFSERVGFYIAQLNDELGNLNTLIESLGLSGVDLREALDPSALAGALSAVLAGIAAFLSDLFLILMIMLFLLAEGSAMMDRVRASVSSDNPQVERLNAIGQGVVLQFGLRAIVNLVTGAGITVMLFLFGVDFPLLWGILTFFLSFIPYIGLVLATAPAVVLALAEFGVERALLVIAGIVVVNVVAENLLSPLLLGRGLSISPTIVFLSFIFWAWLLGGPGAFLALPLTLFVAVMFDTFPETRWLAGLMIVSDSDTDAPPPGAEEAQHAP
jgi:predicted PurR-regulated permease PerM